SSPDTIYFLNNGPVDGPLRVWDYFATLTINPGATVTYSVGDQDGVQLANGAGLVAGTTLDQSAPFNGQYAQIDVVDVVESPNVARTWPLGAELWSRPGGAPSCLRLTTALGTHFVVTA